MTWGTSSGNSSSVPPPPLIRLLRIPPLAIHADSDPMLFQEPSEGLAGELGSLVGVEDLRLTIPQGFFQNLNTEVHLQGIGQLPGQHIAAIPIHDGYQIQEASGHGEVGNVRGPDLVGPGNFYTP